MHLQDVYVQTGKHDMMCHHSVITVVALYACSPGSAGLFLFNKNELHHNNR